MRHRNKINRLGRPAGHRKALLMNLSKSLIMHKRIVTTLAKGKVLRSFIEPILTRAKQDTTHARRMVFSHFQDKVPVKELFNHIVEKIEQRPGGYTRIIKLANRAGDNAAMCMIELVDYNDIYTKEAKVVKTPRRRKKKKTTPLVDEVVAETVSGQG
ncbi:50S ribosomal protein L17 [Cardinium endosymbiont cEper1 of Encarsia pergandiella]|uniref:50S ribosomal protein L17 n=1 Tax=Cardinium endosymbiont of Encarsia pergandiella TaxID=249402 RepID=UPI00027EAADB|nr:50S ribosomal protein L17 [Cardinium endosymbiont of Encarsia pergandiella]CCM09903.1 50S ribosomal protein L17 [Cardinium endosymbiont cEper1 of Encarsia pergandiella]